MIPARNNPHRERAKTLLKHYFDLAGVITDHDNRVEIDEIVDETIAAVLFEVKNILETREAQQK